MDEIVKNGSCRSYLVFRGKNLLIFLRDTLHASRDTVYSTMKDRIHRIGNTHSEEGFALIALMGVLAIVVVLATVMVPNMITSLNTKANETEKETLQAIGKSSATYLRSTHTWAPTLAAHSPGYSPLDSTQIMQNDRLFPRYYALHPDMSGFSNGVGLVESDLADARFLLISNRSVDAAPTITDATEFDTWWTTDESSTPNQHIYRGNLADTFLKVSLTAEGDGGSFQIAGATTNSSGGTLADYTRYHLPGTVLAFDEANTYGTPELQFVLTGNVAYQFDPLCEPGFQWRVVPASPCFSPITLWLSTQGTTSGAPGLDSWTDRDIVSFDNPSLTYETGPSGQTSGTFASIQDMGVFGPSDIDAGHYVNASMTIGGVTLNQGDLLMSTTNNEALTSLNSLSVNDEDVFIFRPVSLDDYSSGTFFMFMDASDVGIGGDIEAFTLVEMNTTVAGLELLQGDVLLYHDEEDVHRFEPTSLGSTTAGTVSLFIEGGDIRIDEDFEGLELIEEQMDIGDITLQAGQILASFELGDSDLGDNRINVDVSDIIILDMTSLGDDTEGTATIVFDGADVGLTTAAEGPDTIMIKGSPSTLVTLSITNPGFETGDLTGWSLTGDLLGSPPAANQWGTTTSSTWMSSPHSGTYFANAQVNGAVGTGLHRHGIYQRVDVSANSAEIDAGTATVTINGYGHGEDAQDYSFLRIAFYDAVSGGNQLGSDVDSNSATQTETWTTLTISGQAIPTGTRSIELFAIGTKGVIGGSMMNTGVDDLSGYLLLP